MKKSSLGLVEYIMFGIMAVLFVLSLPFLIPAEIWMRYRENREQKERMVDCADR